MEQKMIYALGFFDGVHLAHQALLQQCRALAAQYGCTPGVVTFLGHPDTLVSGVTPPLINTAADRTRLLRHFGIEAVVELPFDRALMSMDYRSFLKMLMTRYHAAGFVCGHDFRFGRHGEGNARGLEAFCQEAGLAAAVVPEQIIDSITVSSTHIRSLLEQGNMETAAKFLGHRHILTGTVVPGKKLGRSLGTPTANLVLPNGVLVPKFGVYICRCHFDGAAYPAVTNVGTRPTVEGSYATVEPWILDFDGDLYGRELTLEFYKYLRPERKFPSLTHLQAEILKNGEEVRKFFAKS